MGLWNSRILKAVVLTSAVITTLALLLHPPAWILVASAIALFALTAWIVNPQKPAKALQQIIFELSAISRLFKAQKYDRIEGTDLFLGGQPNRLQSDWKAMKKSGIGAVLSVNEPWEREPMGLSLPFKAADWHQLGFAYHVLDQDDYSLLSDAQLHRGADWIHEQIQQGRKVLVHCKAGKGRSAQVAAAYLIKYKNRSAREACHIIKTARPVTELDVPQKFNRLVEFAKRMQDRQYRGDSRPQQKLSGIADHQCIQLLSR